MLTLAGWERAIVNVSESEADTRRLVYDQLIPALIERGDVGHVLRNALRLAGVSGSTAGDPRATSEPIVHLGVSPRAVEALSDVSGKLSYALTLDVEDHIG